MEYDRLEFIDAIEELAGNLGLEVPHEQGAKRQDNGLSWLISADGRSQ